MRKKKISDKNSNFWFFFRILLWVAIGLSIIILTMLICNAIVRFPAIVDDLVKYHNRRMVVNEERRIAKEEERRQEAERKRLLKEQKEKEQELEKEIEREMAAKKLELERELREKLATLKKERPAPQAPAPSPVAVAAEVERVNETQPSFDLEAIRAARPGPRFFIGEENTPNNFRLEISSALAKRRQEKVFVQKEQ